MHRKLRRSLHCNCFLEPTWFLLEFSVTLSNSDRRKKKIPDTVQGGQASSSLCPKLKILWTHLTQLHLTFNSFDKLLRSLSQTCLETLYVNTSGKNYPEIARSPCTLASFKSKSPFLHSKSWDPLKDLQFSLLGCQTKTWERKVEEKIQNTYWDIWVSQVMGIWSLIRFPAFSDSKEPWSPLRKNSSWSPGYLKMHFCAFIISSATSRIFMTSSLPH